MLICTNCRVELDTNLLCTYCSRQFEVNNGLFNFISDNDNSLEIFKQYMSNYQTIKDDDDSNRILSDEYTITQAKKLIAHIKKHMPRVDVCEVGCGKGHFTRELYNNGFKSISVVEIVEDYLHNVHKSISKDISIFLSNAENLPFRNEFNLIVASDILEHVLNPADFLYSVNSALKCNGYFLVRVPYNEDLHQYSKLKGCKYNFVHLRSYGKDNLIRDLAYSGFKVIDLHYDGFFKYRTRNIYKKFKTIENFIYEKIYDKYFPGDWDLAKVNNILGRILVEPLEIIAVCKKVKDLS